MKKALPYLFPLGYGCLCSLTAVCSLYFLGISLALFPLIGHPLRFLFLCGILLLLSLAGIGVLFILNTNALADLDAKREKRTIAIEIAESLVLFFVTLPGWVALFAQFERVFFR